MVCLLTSTALAQWTNVGTGIDYQALTITMGDGTKNNLFMTRMAVANPNCIINSMIASNRVAGARERPSAMAARCEDAINYWGQAWGQRNDVIVAVNGSFEDANAPAGVIAGGDIYDGWYAKRFDDWGGQMGLVWKFDRSYFIGVCPHYQASGQTVTIGGVAQTFDGINIPRANNLIIYTPQYNNNTLTDNSGVEVLVGLSTPLEDARPARSRARSSRFASTRAPRSSPSTTSSFPAPARRRLTCRPTRKWASRCRSVKASPFTTAPPATCARRWTVETSSTPTAWPRGTLTFS